MWSKVKWSNDCLAYFPNLFPPFLWQGTLDSVAGKGAELVKTLGQVSDLFKTGKSTDFAASHEHWKTLESVADTSNFLGNLEGRQSELDQLQAAKSTCLGLMVHHDEPYQALTTMVEQQFLEGNEGFKLQNVSEQDLCSAGIAGSILTCKTKSSG